MNQAGPPLADYKKNIELNFKSLKAGQLSSKGQRISSKTSPKPERVVRIKIILSFVDIMNVMFLTIVMITGFEPALRPGEHSVH